MLHSPPNKMVLAHCPLALVEWHSLRCRAGQWMTRLQTPPQLKQQLTQKLRSASVGLDAGNRLYVAFLAHQLQIIFHYDAPAIFAPHPRESSQGHPTDMLICVFSRQWNAVTERWDCVSSITYVGCGPNNETFVLSANMGTNHSARVAMMHPDIDDDN